MVLGEASVAMPPPPPPPIPQEDAALVDAVRHYGARNWSFIAAVSGWRVGGGAVGRGAGAPAFSCTHQKTHALPPPRASTSTAAAAKAAACGE